MARSRRALLFVPGTRPDRFAKAIASGADAVCIDLEDAVVPDRKDEARSHAVRFLSEGSGDTERLSGPEIVLRVNSMACEAGQRDLEALVAADGRPDALMVPKVHEPADIEQVHAAYGSRRPSPVVLPLIESAAGLHAVEDIAACSAPIAALLFGGIDLATELGCSTGWDALLYARSRIVHAAALAGVGAIDVPYLDVDDHAGLEREARAARELGFAGKMAIHPSQVPVLQDAFTPTTEEVARAQRVLEAAREAGADGVFLLDGRMVDRPVVRAAESTLARAQVGEVGRARNANSVADAGR